MSGLEDEFSGQVKAQNVDATTPEATRIVKSLGFQSHGLVIRSPEGNILWKQANHRVKIQDVRAALRDLLNSP